MLIKYILFKKKNKTKRTIGSMSLDIKFAGMKIYIYKAKQRIREGQHESLTFLRFNLYYNIDVLLIYVFQYLNEK